MNQTTLRPFSSDRPIEPREHDLLARSPFVETFANSIGSWRGKDSLVLAINGPWGSGKSSLKNMIVESLAERTESPVTVVEFNPWQWAGQEQLMEAFFTEVGVALGTASGTKDADVAKKRPLTRTTPRL